MTLGIGTDNLCIKVYDPVNQKIIAVFDTYKKASARLGVSAELIHRKVTSKRRLYSPKYGLDVAVRIGQKTKEMDELILKTNKYKPL
jgi:hypothetical protein